VKLLSHTLGIFTHPDKEWLAIRSERPSFAQVFLSHVPILALIPVVSGYFGVTRVGFYLGGHVAKLTPGSALILAIVTYCAILIGVYLFGEFINWMAKSYGVEGDEATRHYEGTALAVFATTPIFLSGIIGLYPHVWLYAAVTLLAGSYSVYLIFEGIPILMNMSKERAFMYACSVVTVGLVMLVTVLIGSVILWTFGVGPVYQHDYG
jgi:Yip1 domain